MSHAIKSLTSGLVLLSLALLGVMLGNGSNSDHAEQGIDGVWTGTNGFGPPTEFMTLKLTTNGYGAVEAGGGLTDLGLPGTFTYTLAHGQIRYVTNGTPFLTGTLRYDPAADIIIHQNDAELAKEFGESTEPLVLYRDTNALRNAMLSSMIGASNYVDLITNLLRFFDTLTNTGEGLHKNLERQKAAQPGGTSSESQPIRGQTNSASSTSGSHR